MRRARAEPNYSHERQVLNCSNENMKAYSVDLRQKIVETYENKEGSIREVSQRFQVSRSFVQKLLKQNQLLGSLNPLAHGGGTPPKLTDYVPIIEKILEEKNDATLAELCQNLKERAGIKVSPSTMCRFLQKLNLTRKKNFPNHPSHN
jgi:transposase